MDLFLTFDLPKNVLTICSNHGAWMFYVLSSPTDQCSRNLCLPKGIFNNTAFMNSCECNDHYTWICGYINTYVKCVYIMLLDFNIVSRSINRECSNFWVLQGCGRTFKVGNLLTKQSYFVLFNRFWRKWCDEYIYISIHIFTYIYTYTCFELTGHLYNNDCE